MVKHTTMMEKILKTGFYVYYPIVVGAALKVCFHGINKQITDLRYSGRFLNITHSCKGLKSANPSRFSWG
jgi:hypothetical protein